MGYARKALISLQDTPYYHVIGRCVRRSWLCGIDSYTGKDYSHRKQWVLERLKLLSNVFALDVCAYAIMSNHYHLVVRVDTQRARSWTTEDIIDRWSRVFNLPALVERRLLGETTAAEAIEAERIVQLWRTRLMNVSWYMRCLNEHLARRANAEDDCTGCFWEGRFKSQALLNDAGLLTAMVYVDLNPVRAGISITPEEADFTSIQARIAELANAKSAATAETGQSDQFRLLPFKEAPTSPRLPFSFKSYLTLVDWTSRRTRQDKSDKVDTRVPPILVRLKIDSAAWAAVMRPGGNRFGRALGPLNRLRLHARTLGQDRIKGLHAAAELYSSS